LNQPKLKGYRKLSYQLAAEYLKTLVPEAEAENITPESVREFEANQEGYVVSKDGIRCAPYSSKWFYKKLKAGKYEVGDALDLTVTIKELGDA
jgi:hypothetical protein